jgi:predicted ATPase
MSDFLRNCPDSVLAARIREIAPSWYAQAQQASGTGSTAQRGVPATLQDSVQRQFAAALKEISQRLPVILFIDDFHWSDNASADLIGYLSSKFTDLRSLVVLTYRTEELLGSGHSFVRVQDELLAKGLCQQVTLRLLTENDLIEYVSATLNWSHLSNELPRFIYQYSEGNPLFMINIIDYLQINGVLTEQNGLWTIAAHVDAIKVQMLDSMRNLLRRKIRLLGDEERALLNAASIQGFEFDSLVLADVCKIEQAEVEERLALLAYPHEWIRPAGDQETVDGAYSLKYHFVHWLYRADFLDLMTPSRRVALCRQVADSLARQLPNADLNSSTQLALLYEAGHDYWNAAEHLLSSARAAMRRGALPAAIDLCKLGLELLKKSQRGNKEERELALLLLMGTAQQSFKGLGSEEVRRTYEDARAVCQRLGSQHDAIPPLLALWMFHCHKVELQAALAVAEEINIIAERNAADEALANARYALGMTQLYMGSSQKGMKNLQEAIKLYHGPSLARAELHGVDPMLVTATFSAFFGSIWVGHFAKGIFAFMEAREAARALGHMPTIALLMQMSPPFFQVLGQLKDAKEAAEEMAAFATKYDLAQYKPLAKYLRGSVQVDLCEIGEGLEAMRSGLRELDDVGAFIARPWMLQPVIVALGKLDRCDEALALAQETLDRAAQRGDRYQDCPLLRLKGELLLRLSRNNEAEKVLRQAIRIGRQQGFKLFELAAATVLSRYLCKTDRFKEANTILRPVYSWFTEDFEVPQLVEARRTLEEIESGVRLT